MAGEAQIVVGRRNGETRMGPAGPITPSSPSAPNQDCLRELGEGAPWLARGKDGKGRGRWLRKTNPMCGWVKGL